MKRFRGLRWRIAGLLALATALSYLDRQSLPLLVGEIRRDIAISNAEFARLGSLFLVAYGVMYAVGGRLLDLLGTRVGYTVMIVWWSLANMLTGAASSVMGLGVSRFLLGMGEGGGFPASGKAVAEWFPARERSLAFGIFNTGSSVGAVIAAPLIASVAAVLGWRAVFVVTGAAGLVWAIFWARLYRPALAHPRLGAEERRHIESGFVVEKPGAPARWRDLLRVRQVWGLMAAKLLTDSVWFFFIFWIPKYLVDARGFDLKAIGAVAWIPFACAGAGSLLGGALGTALIDRGASVDRARKIALGAAAALMPGALLIGPTPIAGAVGLFGLVLFAHQLWSANVQTIAADLFPPRLVGSVEGLLGSAGALGAALYGALVGILVERGGYTLPFLLAGVLHPLAFLIIVRVVRRIEPVSLPGRR